MRIIALVTAVLLGTAVGVTGSFVHDVSADLMGIGWPVGLVVALAAAVAAFVAAGVLAGGRLGTVLAAVAWVLSALAVSAPRPEGDVVIASAPSGYIFLYGGTILAAFVATFPVVDGRRTDLPESELR